jgi:hypothetical protein
MHLGSCDCVVQEFYIIYWNFVCFVVACSVLFVRNMGDKLLEHRVNIKCLTEFKKNASTSYSISAYDGTANSNMGVCVL